MNDKKQNRRLSAILSADIKDYKRFMSEDEKATIRTRTYYEEIMAIRIQKHQGRVINSAGNNLLAEFSSVVAALRCAWEIQQEIRVMNARSPKNRKMNFRIGVNFGDVIEEEGRTYGECLNIAIRMEDLAEEGGICISGTAYDQVKNKLPFTYDYQGDYTVENVKEPARAYRIVIERKSAGKVSGNEKKRPKLRKKVALSVNTVVIAAVVVLALWHFYLRDSTPSSEEVVSGERMASLLSDKPSIAVLPFANLNRDAKQENLGDGITTDIITDLAKFKELSIITRDRVLAYIGRPVRVKDVGRELGVQYVVEGSVRRAGNQVRIYAHLMDIQGRRLWAEKYDRDLADLAAVQDEIVQKIATLMEVKREVAE